uniref:Secreted protein n=1 Tax=Cacopsylla melanoneura TaxID=428564 RepID=A0A8D8RP75_9HEMI
MLCAVCPCSIILSLSLFLLKTNQRERKKGRKKRVSERGGRKRERERQWKLCTAKIFFVWTSSRRSMRASEYKCGTPSLFNEVVKGAGLQSNPTMVTCMGTYCKPFFKIEKKNS